MAIVHATDNNFETTSTGEKVLVKFEAAWCKPCKMLTPIVEEVANASNLKVVTVDIDESPAITTKYSIRGVPTLVLLNDGKEVKRHVGMAAKSKISEFIGE